MKSTVTLCMAAVAGVMWAQPVLADPPKPAPGVPMSGKGLAQLKCSPCHAIDGKSASPNIKAPPFPLIAKSKMVTAREVDAWLQTAHPDMPSFGLTQEQRGDIVAYFQSLWPMDPMQ